MPIAMIGQVNVSALNVPQALIQIVPPQYLFAGVPTNVGGYIGTASWGPVNLPRTFGNYAQYSQTFGPTINRLNDIGGHIILSQLQGAAYFCGVRITDGTDTAATGVVLDAGVKAAGTITFASQPSNNSTITLNGTVVTFVTSGAVGNQVNIGVDLAATLVALKAFLDASTDAQIIKCTYAVSATVLTITYATAGTAGNSFTLAAGTVPASNGTVSGATLAFGAAPTTGATATAKYSGTFGAGIKINVFAGVQSGTYKIVITAPGFSPEVFDNIGLGLTGANLWAAIVSAVNNGSSTIRPASDLIVLAVGASVLAPGIVQNALSGGSDGVSSLTTAHFIGVDALPRTGMYALRGQNTAQFTLCDCTDMAALSTMEAFGLSEGTYGVFARAASDTLSAAQTALADNGIDTFTLTVIFGDWPLWLDTINNVARRTTSPAAIKMGLLGNLSPEQNTLNKPIRGIVGTQSSVLGKTYSYSDFQTLAQARMDLICLDRSLTNHFVFRQGINTSSSPVIKGDEYTRITYFLAKSLQEIANQYIGSVITPRQMRQAKIAFDTFLGFAEFNGIIGTFDGTQAYQTVIDKTNNSQATVALGYEYAYIKVIYQGILRYFIVNLEGGASVTIENDLTLLPPAFAA